MRNPREQGKTRARKLVQASVVGILLYRWRARRPSYTLEDGRKRGNLRRYLARSSTCWFERQCFSTNLEIPRAQTTRCNAPTSFTHLPIGHLDRTPQGLILAGYRRLQVDLFEPRTAEVQSLSSARALISARTRATTITSIASWGFSNTLLRHRNKPFKKPSIRVPFSRPTRQDHCRTFGTRRL